MLAAYCPRCGSPTPISLASHGQLHCRHCSYQGAGDAETQQHVAAAAQALHHMDARQRQLTGMQRRMVGSGLRHRWTYLGLFTLLVLPFVLCGGTCTAAAAEDEWGWPLIVTGLSPLAFMLLAGWLGLRSIDKHRHKLQEQCAAVPPQAPGQPALCHVCGAPLQAAAGAAIARCAFCGADNVVDPAVLQRMQRRQATAVQSLAQEVQRHASVLGAAAGRASRNVFIGALGAPLIGIAVIVTLAMVMVSCPMPANDEVQYAEWRSGDAACLAIATRKDGKLSLDFKKRGPVGVPDKLSVADDGKVKIHEPKDLVGMAALVPGNRVGKVTKVYRQLDNFERNIFDIEVTGATTTQYRVEGHCLPPKRNPIVKLGSLEAETPNFMGQTEDEIFAVVHHQVLAVPKAGGSVRPLFPQAGGLRQIQGHHKTLYVLSTNKGLISMSTNGKDVEELDVQAPSDGGLAMDATHLFWSTTGGIKRRPLAGSEEHETIIEDAGQPVALTLDAERIYWFESVDGSSDDVSLRSARKDGSQVATLLERTGPHEPYQLVVGGKRLFWISSGLTLMAMSTKGGKPTVLGSSMWHESGVALAPDRLVFGCSVNGATRHGGVVTLPLDATSTDQARNVAPGGYDVENVIADGEAVYWVDEWGDDVLFFKRKHAAPR